ncbi:MAG: RsmB/NOP family class I SAM-dependent RNA methyltransferase [Sphaerochaetaceae bacterium]
MDKLAKIVNSFDTFYHQMYQDRWPLLKEALLKESKSVPFNENLLKPYYLDEASIICANQLPITENDKVLDMCSAPGGKALILVQKLSAEGSLVCNDRSSARRNRLRKVLSEHLNESKQTIIKVTSHDATKWGLYEQNVYDAILLDAPCSAERHLLQNKKALLQWSSKRSSHLAITQFAMVAAALEAVKIGGFILYSTCSISNLENEGIIEKLHKKREGRFEVIETKDLFLSESLKYGNIVLPDKFGGKGPLFFVLLRRLK